VDVEFCEPLIEPFLGQYISGPDRLEKNQAGNRSDAKINTNPVSVKLWGLVKAVANSENEGGDSKWRPER